jgi:hypothetical protein
MDEAKHAESEGIHNMELAQVPTEYVPSGLYHPAASTNPP